MIVETSCIYASSNQLAELSLLATFNMKNCKTLQSRNSAFLKLLIYKNTFQQISLYPIPRMLISSISGSSFSIFRRCDMKTSMLRAL